MEHSCLFSVLLICCYGSNMFLVAAPPLPDRLAVQLSGGPFGAGSAALVGQRGGPQILIAW